MPDGTSFLQTLDTHLFSRLKTSLLKAKARVHEQEEAAFFQLGQPYVPNWGPRQLASCVAEAWAQETSRASQSNWIVECGMENQLWVWRPDDQGGIISVDQDQTLQDMHRMPPSKGIVASWAQNRMDNSPLAKC